MTTFEHVTQRVGGLETEFFARFHQVVTMPADSRVAHHFEMCDEFGREVEKPIVVVLASWLVACVPAEMVGGRLVKSERRERG